MATQKYILELETKADGTYDTLNKVSKGLDDVAASESKVSEATKETSKQLRELKAAMANLSPNTEQWQKLAKEYKELGGNTKALGTGLKDLRGQLAEMPVNTDEYKELSKIYVELGGKAKDLSTDQLPKLKAQLSTLDINTEQFTQLGNEYVKLGGKAQDLTDIKLPQLKAQLGNLDINSDQFKALSEEYVKLGGKIDDVVPKSKTLKEQIRETQRELSQGAETLGQDKYDALSQKLGALKDQLKDVGESSGQFAGPPLENLGNIAGGFGDRLKTLDVEGFGQDIRNLAGNIKNVSFKGIIDGVKGLGGAFKALGAALASNPIFLIAGIIAAIAFGIKALVDSEREEVTKLNSEIDKSTAQRKDRERLANAQAAGDTKKLYELKAESNRADLADTQKKIDNLVGLQKSYVGISDEQEQELANLRDKYRTQEIDREIIKQERINALNDKRATLADELALVGLSEREAAEKRLTTELEKRRQELIALGATQQDLTNLETVYTEKLNKSAESFDTQANAKAQARREKAKSDADALAANRKQVIEEITKSQQALADINRTEQDKELRASEEKYKKLKADAEKYKLDTTEIVKLAAQEQASIREKYDKQTAAASKAAKDEQLAELEQLQLELEQLQRGAQQTEIDAIQETYFYKKTLLEQSGADTTALTEQFNKEKAEIDAKYAQEGIEKEKEAQSAKEMVRLAGLSAQDREAETQLLALKLEYDEKIKLAKKYGEDTTALEQAYGDKQQEIRRQAVQAQVDMYAKSVGDALSALNGLNEAKSAEIAGKLSELDKQIEGARTKEQRDQLIKRRAALEIEAKKSFDRNKKLQIAQTAISTAANAINAYGSQIIVGDPTSVVRGAIAAAAVAAAGLAQIAKIRSTQYESSAPPASESIQAPNTGGADGGNNANAVPQFNPLDLAFLQNRPDQTPRAFVLAGDVQSGIQARDRVEELARL